MTTSYHTSAKPSHYNQESLSYDALNEENSKIINQTIETFLKQYQVKRVLDLTCGTGSQVFWLAKRGYEVVGSDFNSKMLKIAKEKARNENLSLRFLKGDMRTIQVGEFDAVLTIFNAVGHLTKEDFDQAMGNIHANLKKGGVYIFDIFNLDYLLAQENITKLTVDCMNKDKTTRKIQYSTIDEKGVLASHTTTYTQGDGKTKIT